MKRLLFTNKPDPIINKIHKLLTDNGYIVDIGVAEELFVKCTNCSWRQYALMNYADNELWYLLLSFFEEIND